MLVGGTCACVSWKAVHVKLARGRETVDSASDQPCRQHLVEYVAVGSSDFGRLDRWTGRRTVGG